MKPETFFDNFEVLADAPNGIQKLREMILQLAVRGKLVAQDKNDESASVLLEKIKVERERLIKENKIRKTEPMPVKSDEIPYDLPKSWEWTRLSQIGEINPRNNADNSQEVSFVPMNLISATYGESVKSEIRRWGEVKKGFTHFAEEDVVLAKITPCFQNGKSMVMHGLTNGLGAGTTELHVFRHFNNLILPDYVLIYLKSPMFITGGISKMTGSAGQKRVPNDYFSTNPFPLPPIEEQHRIVAKVDQFMSLCDELEARQQKKRESRARLKQRRARPAARCPRAGGV